MSEYVQADIKFKLDGPTGDTYLIYVSALQRLELWVDGVIKRAWG